VARGKFAAEDFRLGAAVYSSDDKEVGKLHRVLVDEDDYELKALVVKESRRFSGQSLSPGSMLVNDELVVPKQAVKAASSDRIDLAYSAPQIRRLPPYLSYRSKSESVPEELEDFASVLGSSPAVPSSVQEVANKPEGALEIEAGENVMLGHTGKKLGTVKGVLFDDGDLVGVVLRPEGLFRREVILPRRFLDRSDDAALFARLDEDDLEHLKPYRPNDDGS
jgi:sporulation protein YlmC with PRC-barrel domain